MSLQNTYLAQKGNNLMDVTMGNQQPSLTVYGHEEGSTTRPAGRTPQAIGGGSGEHLLQ